MVPRVLAHALLKFEKANSYDNDFHVYFIYLVHRTARMSASSQLFREITS